MGVSAPTHTQPTENPYPQPRVMGFRGFGYGLVLGSWVTHTRKGYMEPTGFQLVSYGHGNSFICSKQGAIRKTYTITPYPSP